MLHPRLEKREAVGVHVKIPRARLPSLFLMPLNVAVVVHGRLFLSQNLRL